MELTNIEKHNADHRRFVLVVDSSDRSRRLLSTLLKQFDYKVYPVSTTEEAVEVAAVIRPVLIVTAGRIDADHDAVRLITTFRSASPECTAPFIVLIAKPDPAFERECMRAGALTCLNAPITFENFYRVIQIAIEPLPRMTIRITTNLPAAINKKRTDECVQELSENGAYLMTSTLHPLGTRLPVQIKLPDCVVSADAVVIYAKQSAGDAKDSMGMGLQFERISEEDQKRIRLFIRREMTKDIVPTPPDR
jgi:response regulator RpfG family c-di-GMP phosphodiesterase